MDFASLPFLFFFLPLLLAVYLLADVRYRPAFLLVASLLFLAAAGPSTLMVFALLIGANFFFGRWIEKSPASRARFSIGIAFNLALLVFYKVFTAYRPLWFVTAFERVMPDALEQSLLHIVYPIGLSYVALQLISYLADIARGAVPSEKSFVRFALYAALFPKIPTGPIALYCSLREDLSAPAPALPDVADGLRRFGLGFIKKTLIADQLAKIANPAFNLPSPNFPPHIAWLALVAFTLQIYYDFSGFADMAIGLGRAFGFRLPENFDRPFTARSVSEFWRRWHMTLAAWFREYVFYPLERRRLPILGQQFNILLVFFLTGLWHGPTLTFAAWGLIHGAALALESTAFGRWLKNTPRLLQFLYMISVVMFALIFFRSPSLGFAAQFIGRLAGNTAGLVSLPFSMTRPLPFVDPTTWLALGLAILLQLPLASFLTPSTSLRASSWRARVSEQNPRFGFVLRLLVDVSLLTLFWLGIAALVSGTNAPGIYDKF
jgi:alginate O-acetyltransferase complex protein AlgI